MNKQDFKNLEKNLGKYAPFVKPLVSRAKLVTPSTGAISCKPSFQYALFQCSKNNAVVGGLLQRPHVVLPLLQRLSRAERLTIDEIGSLSTWCPLLRELLPPQGWTLQIPEDIIPFIKALENHCQRHLDDGGQNVQPVDTNVSIEEGTSCHVLWFGAQLVGLCRCMIVGITCYWYFLFIFCYF